MVASKIKATDSGLNPIKHSWPKPQCSIKNRTWPIPIENTWEKWPECSIENRTLSCGYFEVTTGMPILPSAAVLLQTCTSAVVKNQLGMDEYNIPAGKLNFKMNHWVL